MLREAGHKDRASSSSSSSSSSAPSPFTTLLHQPSTTTSYAKSEFRKQALGVKRTDFRRIEYMIRKGEKHLKVLQMPGTKLAHGAS